MTPVRSRLAFVKHCSSAAALALAFFLAPAARAQVADAVAEVTVTDAQGGVLPGASLSLGQPSTGFSRVDVSSPRGIVRFAALPPGTYELRVTLAGFAPVKETLVLRVGQSARLTVAMKAAAAEEVTVVGEASLVDVHKLDSSTNIVPEQIESLPVADRDFQKLAFLTPGVQRERGGFRFITNGPVIGAGGNASQSTILVDGVDFTDPSLGLARARFSQDAVSEFRVIANRFDAEVGGSAGGGLSIVTRSGTNDVTGSAFGFFRDKSLRSQGKLDLQKNDFSREQFGFTLGGPIVRDETHFFASVEQINEDNVSPFRPGGAFASQAADVAHPFKQTLAFLGLDHRINDGQHLKAKFVYERYREENFRVGGVGDVTSGMELNRDNWNFTVGHSWTPGSKKVNQLSFQIGGRKYEEPPNSTALAEYFSSGNTLITGENIVGGLLGKSAQFELRDTFSWHIEQGTATHDIKIGGALQHVKDRFNFPVYPAGVMFYVTDSRALPLLYVYGEGSGDATISTNQIAGFIQDDFRPKPNLTLNLALRYDLDTNGNNPDFTHPLVAAPRGRDSNNFQPRAGFSWDPASNGRNVIRGGVGLFTGRFLLVPAFGELQQNGVTGRVIGQRVNGALLGLPAFALNPANPRNSGLPLNVAITLLDRSYVNPQATQATLGWTTRLGGRGLYFDLEGVYVKGKNEIIVRDKNFAGNAAVAGGAAARPNNKYDQINTYTNEGRSEYKAVIASINGTIKGGHIVTASFTYADKKNINDDFSPALVDYPSDPSNIEGEYGRSRADERFRAVISAVFRLPAAFTVAPILEYGSGQPWNQRVGYDFNGDGKVSDRAAGVSRFSSDGPRFKQVSLRLTRRFRFGAKGGVDAIAEGFNLFNTVNYDVNSVQSGQYLSGPTLTNKTAAYVANPRFGQYLATLPPREFQLGVRLTF
ncbi:MAG: TonB-dependent receptor [Vicinamibacteria bacterium]|nr:TonB-dependent receptor [Vicinamibacteria bacterium]